MTAGVRPFALFGGPKLFGTPKSTSSLARPDFEAFMRYSREFFDAGQYSNNGPAVRRLESRLAQFHEAAHCVTFCSGFWALVLAVRSLALPGRREVVMPSLTYRRLADVVSWAGFVPRFCDVDEATLALTPETVRPHLGPETALLLAVHPIVNCCDAPALERLAAENGVPLLFDAVESVYETVGGKRVGSGFGRAEVFSMHASKLLNGFEAGYLTTNDAALARDLRLLRGFGFNGPDDVIGLGTNAKLNEVHAAMGLAALDDLPRVVADNRANYEAYRHHLAGIPGLRLLAFDESESCSYKNIVVELLDDWPLQRDLSVKVLNAENVLARAYYSPPLHLKPVAYEVIATPLPRTERLAGRFLLLPCGHFVSPADVATVASLLADIRARAPEILRNHDQTAS